MRPGNTLSALALCLLTTTLTIACGDDDDSSGGGQAGTTGSAGTTSSAGTTGSAGTAGSSSGNDAPAECVALKACCDAITKPSEQTGCNFAYDGGVSSGIGKVCQDDLDERHAKKECP